MKLLLMSVQSEQSRGGIATWTARFLDACEAHGISCTLVNTETVGKRQTQGTARRSALDEFVRTRRIFRDLRAALKQGKYDAAHLNTSCGTFGLFRDLIAAKRIRRKGIRTVTHFHCDIPYWIHNPLSRWALGRLVALSDVRLVLCENSRLYLEKTFGASSEKIPNVLDDNMIRADEKPVADTISTAFFVGRVSEAKGARELYELASRLPHITFRLAGVPSDTVAAWSKPENVVLVGSLPHAEVLSEMDRADVFIFPSHSEGFSLALTEAMARGLPSVATDVGANADMLADGCGFVVKKCDVDGMVAAMEALTDPDARREVSRRAAEKARRAYATDVIVEQIRSYYL